MKVLKVKNFRVYQAVQIPGHGMVNYYLSGHNDRLCFSHDAFYAPDLAAVILKKKACGSEIMIPLTNVQNFELEQPLIVKGKSPEKEQEETPAPVPPPIDTVAPECEPNAGTARARIAELNEKKLRLTKPEKAELKKLITDHPEFAKEGLPAKPAKTKKAK